MEEAAGGLAVALAVVLAVVLGVRASVMGPAVVARVASGANCCVPAKLPEGPWLRVSVTWAPAHTAGTTQWLWLGCVLHGAGSTSGEAACRAGCLGAQGEG